ncbi:MAG: replicative DNA helicase [Deltaproteobacteria bacterium]|nr:replicative DNA helicase [Deltaproteobacteria bacterium]MBW2019220.1 replicative DNA helicase [Deltaproteobacteria bacterium]MBW2074026.1 replicative DNA helicase [Deltaproteobacteria bacterium]RLB80385.1 MAG: replicative DNA helicase [Deltaproteobacteria bacterium]
MSNKDPWLQKVPPQNIEAEQSLLSAILIENTTLPEVLEILSEKDFYRESHRKIFSAMVDLFERNEPADLVTVKNILKEQGHLESVGGASYLAELVDTVPMATNAAHYAKIIHEKATLRRLIERTASITTRCFEDRGNMEEILDFAERAIFDISEDKVKPTFHSLADILTDTYKAVEEAYENKLLVTGIPTGYSQLDQKTSGFQPGDLIVIAGRPSMGKTALALNLARNASIETGIPLAIFSLEMSKEQLSLRMLSAEARIDSSRMRGGWLSETDLARINRAAGALYDLPIYIDDSPAISALEIRAKARRMKMEKGLGLVIIDYLQLMRGRASAERRDLEISEISRSLKALAKELNLPVVALSQLNRKVEDRSDKRPVLSDLRESGAIEQDADVILFIYRDEVYHKDENNPNKGTAEIIVAKQRNGPIGTVKLAFLEHCTRFENLATEAESSN